MQASWPRWDSSDGRGSKTVTIACERSPEESKNGSYQDGVPKTGIKTVTRRIQKLGTSGVPYYLLRALRTKNRGEAAPRRSVEGRADLPARVLPRPERPDDVLGVAGRGLVEGERLPPCVVVELAPELRHR